MKAIREAFENPENVSPREIAYGFRQYAKNNDASETYLEYDGFDTNEWFQKDTE